MKYDAVIFDMDGTVLDTLGDLTATLNHALAAFGYPPRTAAETRSFIGNGVRVLLARGAGEELSEEKMKLMYKAFVEYYKEHLTDKTRPYDGITDLLRSLRAAGVRVALLSNKADFAVAILCRKFFNGLFDLYYGEREGIPRKPDPAGAAAIMNELGATPARTLYVGDSGVDLATAHAADLDCVLVGWGYLNSEVELTPGRDRTADTPEDVLKTALGEE
ncbi:MAG: HAD-IA family hydrolase [Clostridia bacterium]|nr:HAD-IA family hydrolase [Clostridia bacterium]MBR6914948.1 HAD-IA family hydrolase [Clostridia bacterium]